MKKIRVGSIVNTFGIKGELKIKSLSDFSEERFKKGVVLMVNYENRDEELTVKSARFHKNHYLVLFEGLEDINLVEKYKGLDIYIAAENRKKLSDSYYSSDLIGLTAYDKDTVLGVVSDVDVYPMYNVLRISNNNREKDILVPFVDAFIEKVDLENKTIHILVIEGLL